MKSKKKVIYIALAIILTALMAIRLTSNKKITEERVYHYNKEQEVHVQSVTLIPESVNYELSFPGIFEPNKETRISAEVQGKINTMNVDLGSRVRRNEVVIQLDNSLLKLQLQSVEIQIAGLESDVKRYTILADADAIQGIQLEKAVLALESARVQKATLEEQIRKTSIVAPFEGIVTAKLTEVGAFAAPGVPLLQITDISSLRFTVNVPEHELDQFEPNHLYSISADIFPETQLTGTVVMTGSKANIGNSFPVQFSVANTPDLKIKSGMFGKVSLKDSREEKAIVIPASAIIGTNIQPQVYVVRNGKAVLQSIAITDRFQNKAVVSSGLMMGDTLVTNGFINLYDGAFVSTN